MQIFFSKSKINIEKYKKVLVLSNSKSLSGEYQGYNNLIDYRKELDIIFTRYKKRFINYIAEIEKFQTDKKKWYATSISAHNNLQTDFYDKIVFLKLAEYFIKKNECDLIVTDDPIIFKLIKDNLSLPYKFKNKLYSSFHIYKYIIISFLRMIVGRLFFLFKILEIQRKWKNKLDYIEDSIYLYSWMEERCFNNKKFEDQYLSGVDSVRIKKEKSIFISYYTDPSLYHYWNQIDLKVNGLQNYFNLMNLFKSILIFPYFKNTDKKFLEFNLKLLWKLEFYKELKNNSFCYNLLEFYSWKYFFNKSSGIMIYPFENQSWEKVMLLANSVQKMKMIGYQHSSIGLNYLTYLSTKKEMEDNKLPDVLVTNSEENRKYLLKHFPGYSNIIDGGTKRYNKKSFQKNYKKSKKIIIGVFLPLIQSQAKELLFHINKNASKTPYKFLIKSHPNMDLKGIKTGENIEHFKGSAIELYSVSNAIIYCTSTAGSEAYSYGIPVFRFRGSFVDYKMGENAFQPKIIDSILEITQENLKNTNNKFLYSEFNYSVWENILN